MSDLIVRLLGLERHFNQIMARIRALEQRLAKIEQTINQVYKQ
jgi:hypothetical protein